MSPDKFYQTRQSDWGRLTTLLDRYQGHLNQLGADDVAEIGRLYRATTADLALAQRDYPQHDVTHYLNQLTARTHAIIYRPEPFSLHQIWYFFSTVIPRTFRETLPFTLAAMALLFLPAIVVGITTRIAPETATVLVPIGVQSVISEIEAGEPWFNFENEDSPLVSSAITTNNIRVSFLAFAGGMTAGLLTVLVLVQNGLMLGGIIGLAAHHEFYALFHFIIGHGVIEMSMICVSGGAGLLLGWAIISPTPYSRSDAIAKAARKAIILAVTCALFLIIAGLIEGFISPKLTIPVPAKWATGIGSGVLMYGYLFLAGRGEQKF